MHSSQLGVTVYTVNCLFFFLRATRRAAPKFSRTHTGIGIESVAAERTGGGAGIGAVGGLGAATAGDAFAMGGAFAPGAAAAPRGVSGLGVSGGSSPVSKP